jgi:hypothetical protein
VTELQCKALMFAMRRAQIMVCVAVTEDGHQLETYKETYDIVEEWWNYVHRQQGNTESSSASDNRSA